MNRKQRRADPSRFLNEGVDCLQKGAFAEAQRALEKAVKAAPRHPDALYLLGMSLHLQGHHAKAADRMADALTHGLRDHPETLNNAGKVFNAAGRYAEAAETCRRALGMVPNASELHNGLGSALAGLGDAQGAVDSFLAAVKLNPRFAAAYVNLANLLAERDQVQDAKAFLEKALAVAPGDPDALAALAGVLVELGSFQEGLDTALAVLACLPDHAAAHAGAGAALVHLHRVDAALPHLKKGAAAPRPPKAALLFLGDALTTNGDYRGGYDALARAVDLYPDFTPALAALCINQMQQCLWTGLDAVTRELDARNERQLATGQVIFEPAFDYVTRCMAPKENFLAAKSQSAMIARRAAAMNRQYSFPPRPESARRLRLGYLSNDYREHPVGQTIRRLFELHDRDGFEVFAYSGGRDDGSDIRRHFERTADHFIDIRGMDEGQAADRIHADGIDILIDLSGHTLDNRMAIAALRPASRQVLWLGYPGTSGGDFFDYAIVDPVIAPADHRPYFSEKLIDLPHTYLMVDDQLAISDRTIPRAEEGLPESGFVFASFCGPRKYEPVMFAAWMDIVKAVPGSILWLAAGNEIIQANLRAEAGRHGVGRERLVFAGRRPSKAEHLARLRLAGLALDTRVFNGHVTTADYLLAGTPVVAMEGGHFASRVSASLLAAAGLPDLVAPDLDAYKALAIRLAKDPGGLAEVRRRLADARGTAPLFDTPGFVRDLEAAYRRIWREG